MGREGQPVKTQNNPNKFSVKKNSTPTNSLEKAAVSPPTMSSKSGRDLRNSLVWRWQTAPPPSYLMAVVSEKTEELGGSSLPGSNDHRVTGDMQRFWISTSPSSKAAYLILPLMSEETNGKLQISSPSSGKKPATLCSVEAT